MEVGPLRACLHAVDVMDIQPVIERLREKAQDMRPITPEGANALELAAEIVEEYALEWGSKELTLKEAAAESGYSTDQLRRHIAQGRIQNAGQTGAPRIRRRNLPKKPGPRQPQPDPDSDPEGPDLAGKVLQAQGLAVSRELA